MERGIFKVCLAKLFIKGRLFVVLFLQVTLGKSQTWFVGMEF